MSNWVSRTVVGMVCLLGVPCAGLAQTSSAATEEFAQGQFRLALEFMRKGRYQEALTDLQRVVDAYPTSSVADDSLLEIARYHLEVARDIDMAQKTTSLLLQKYPATDVTPLAYVMAGRIGMMQASAADQVDAVMANFERAGMVPRLDVTPVASFHAGQALRIGGRPTEAVDRFMRVVVEYPRSPWAARSLLGLARAWLSLGEPARAMAALQRVRERFPGTADATTALAWNTLLYRLYVRAPKAPAFSVAAGAGYVEPSGKLEDVRAVVPVAEQRLLVATSKRAIEFGPDGKVIRTLFGDDARGLVPLPGGRLLVLTKENLVSPGGSGALALAVPKPDGSPRRLEDLRAAVSTELGTLLVADGDLRAITRFGAEGKSLGEFAPLQVSRLATNDLGEVAALDRNARTVVRFNRAGRPIGRVLPKGTGYELRNPVDIAFDPVGHLYVLDRDAAAVFVFGARDALVTAFMLDERAPGAFRRATALGVDEIGQLFISDDRAERIQVYR